MCFNFSLNRFSLLILTLAAAMLTSCHSSRKATASSAYTFTPPPATRKAAATSPSAGALVREAESWLGTPYKYGGNDRNGVDCSGFVLRVYKDALGISLPRTSREQRDFCPYVSTGALYPGDLLFFSSDSSRDRVTHVGIFMGDNLMIHASSSRGVIVTDITTSYYQRNYMGGGQVEQYHAMIGSPSKPRKKASRPDPQPETPQIHISQLESPTGFSLTPVKELPQRTSSATKTPEKTPGKSKTTATSGDRQKSDSQKSAAKATKSKSNTADTPRDTSSMSAEEARAAVLGSLPEQNLDQQ